jgi:hypothetical protein
MNAYGSFVEIYWQVKTEVLEGKSVPVSRFPPQISGWLAWDRTQASAVTNPSHGTFSTTGWSTVSKWIAILFQGSTAITVHSDVAWKSHFNKLYLTIVAV